MLHVQDLSTKSINQNPRILGRVQGTAAKKALHDYYKAFKSFCRKIRGGGIFGPITGFFAGKYLINLGTKYESFIESRYREEMIGIAEGSGLDYEFIRFINVMDDIANTFLCSSLAVYDTTHQSYVVAANLDYPVLIEHLAANVLVAKRPEYWSVGFPGYVGVLRGINQHGCVVTSLTSKTDRNRVGVPNGLLYRSLLEKERLASSITMNILSNNDRGASNNVLVSDRENAWVVEFVYDDQGMISPERDGGGLCATNHFRSHHLVKYQKIVQPDLPTDVRPEYFTKEYSRERLCRLECFFQEVAKKEAEGKIIDYSGLLDQLLTAAYPLCNEGTVVTTIFNQPKKELTVCVPKTGERQVVSLDENRS